MGTFFVLTVSIATAQAQAHLTFSGGNGTPLSITLQQSVTYTINSSLCSSGNGSVFVFDEAGTFSSSDRPPVTGTITFSINGGAAQTFNQIGSDVNLGNVTTNDIYLLGTFQSVSNGSTVTLSAGTLTTTNNVAVAPFANGSFTTFIVGSLATRCSANGVAVTPTAASVSIAGRVLTTSGHGLSKASVYLTDAAGNTRAAKTNPFGYYRFEGVQAGQTVTLVVVSKRYQFDAQSLNVNEEMNGVDFLAQ